MNMPDREIHVSQTLVDWLAALLIVLAALAIGALVDAAINHDQPAPARSPKPPAIRPADHSIHFVSRLTPWSGNV
jgi:hypothetical protein